SLQGVRPPVGAIPLLVSLRDFVHAQEERPHLSFLAHLEVQARERLQISEAHRAFFEAALRMGEAIVLLDGLDQVGGEAARHRVATQIRTLRAEYPDCGFWVTSRLHGYTSTVRLPDEDFAHYRIEWLDDGLVDRRDTAPVTGARAKPPADEEPI